MIHQVKLATDYRDTCIRDLLANSEYVHERTSATYNITDYAIHTCCAINQWEECIVQQLTNKCGSEAGEVFPHLIHHTSLFLTKNLCSPKVANHKDPRQCDPELFQAPENYIPQGYKSSTFLSYYFSYMCPNVAYGIDD